MGRDYHKATTPRQWGIVFGRLSHNLGLPTYLAVLSLVGSLRSPCRPRGLTPSGLNCHHDASPGAYVRGGRRTRWPRILGRGVRRPYRTRGYVISQGGYIQGPPGPPEPFVPPPRGTRVPPGTGGPRKKSKSIHGYGFCKFHFTKSIHFQKSWLWGVNRGNKGPLCSWGSV